MRPFGFYMGFGIRTLLPACTAALLTDEPSFSLASMDKYWLSCVYSFFAVMCAFVFAFSMGI